MFVASFTGTDYLFYQYDLKFVFKLAVPYYSEKLFQDVWMKEFPWVKIMKHDTFSKCTKCTTLTSIIDNSKDPVKKAQAIKERDLHWQRVTTERRNVEAARNQSRQDKDFFFCEIDGMDSAKTSYFTSTPGTRMSTRRSF